MLAIPGIAALVIFIYARPQEFFERLRALPFLHLFFALALFGVVIDVRTGNLRVRPTPQLAWVMVFFSWASLTVVLRAPQDAFSTISELAICLILYALIAHGVQTFRALHMVSTVVLAMVLLVCGVGVHQAFAPLGCVKVVSASNGNTTGFADGRPCQTGRECYAPDSEPGAEYVCEHVGLFGTTSVGGGRVRYRGVLQDPNELALAGGVGLPLAFASGRPASRTTFRRATTALFAFVLVLVCAMYTGSRGGQLVFLVVLGAYFLRRYGKTGLALGGILAIPLFVAGGRSGAEASSSTMERIDCWAEALSIWRSHPILGVGLGQFGEFNSLTAHNSYLLTLAELGLPGMIAFTIIVYVSTKIPFVALRTVTASQGPGVAAGVPIVRPWAMALLASFAGLAVGIYFLSFAYHYVLWIFIGLSGALYSAVRTHWPEFKVPFGWKDAAIVVALDVAIIAFTYAQTKAMLR